VGDAIAQFEIKVDDSHSLNSWKRHRQMSIWSSVSLGIRILGIAVVWGFAALSATTNISEAVIAWESFTRAVAFEDGHLLMMGAHPPIWLSDQTLSHGTPEGVGELLAEKVREWVRKGAPIRQLR